MKAAAAALAIALSVGTASAQERSLDAVVLMRVTANVTVTLQDGSERQFDNIPLRTGTGTIVSRLGHIVTNEHVVGGGTVKAHIGNVPATVTINVNRIEACFPPSKTDRLSGCVEASVLASDAALDLAILTMSGNDFPYVPLGDSDVVRMGSPCQALGYPLGEELDIGRQPSDEGLAPTMTGGQVSALRADEQGTLRYVQTSAALNPGNSGGPLTDRAGFAIGIVEAKVRDAAAIGFAIPINIVKEFLARSGVEPFLPSARLTLGYVFDSPEKLMRIQVPPGFEDAARSRLQIDSGSSIPVVALRIDRVASRWTLEQVESELLQGRAFEKAPSTREQSALHEERVLRGEAYSHGGGRSVRTVYAIVDLGGEKIVARYVGSAEQVAFNESILSASLASLEAAPMITTVARTPRDGAWVAVAQPSAIAVTPAGWIIDAGAPLPCGELAEAHDSLVTSPQRDFTVSFRVGQRAAGLDPKQAAAECGDGRGSSTDNEYRYTFSRLGIEYTVNGRFHSLASTTLQLEVVAPTRKFAAARDLFSRWVSELGLRSPSS